MSMYNNCVVYFTENYPAIMESVVLSWHFELSQIEIQLSDERHKNHMPTKRTVWSTAYNNENIDTCIGNI